MFPRSIHIIDQLSDYEKIDILRMTLEGAINFVDIMHAKSEKEIHEIRRNAMFSIDLMHEVIEFNRFMSAFETRNPLAAEAEKILSQYKQFSIPQRIRESEKYEVRLLKHVNPESLIYKKFKELCSHDNDVMYVLDVFVSLYAKKIYACDSISVKEQINCLSMLADSTLPLPAANHPLYFDIKLFRRYCSALRYALVTEDKQQYITSCLEFLVKLECKNRAPLNKMMHYLAALNDEIHSADWNVSAGLFGGKEPPKLIVKLRQLMSDMPDSYCQVFENEEAKLQIIKQIFSNVLDILREEEWKKALFPDKKIKNFCRVWCDKADKMIDQAVDPHLDHAPRHEGAVRR